MPGVSDWLSTLFGGGPKTIADTRPPAYPTLADVANARANDLSYGDPAAAYVQPAQVTPTKAVRENQAPLASTFSGALPQYPTLQQLQTAVNAPGAQQQTATAQPVTSTLADRLAAAHLATQRSALAALGFDPRVMAFGTQPEKNLNLAGVYLPDEDKIISTGVSETNPVHESMHRGMQQLRAAGMLPPDAAKMSEESIVRAMMLKSYGPVEKGLGATADAQVADGEYYLKTRADPLAQLEAAAAALFSQKRPMGPR